MLGTVPRLLVSHQKRVEMLDNILKQGLHYNNDQLLEILCQKPFLLRADVGEMEDFYISLLDKGFSSSQIRSVVRDR